MAPGKCGGFATSVFFHFAKWHILSVSSEIDLWWVSQNPVEDESKLVQVTAIFRNDLASAKAADAAAICVAKF